MWNTTKFWIKIILPLSYFDSFLHFNAVHQLIQLIPFSTLDNITYPGFMEVPFGASIKPYLRLKLHMQPTNGKYSLLTVLEPEDNLNNHQLHPIEGKKSPLSWWFDSEIKFINSKYLADERPTLIFKNSPALSSLDSTNIYIYTYMYI